MQTQTSKRILVSIAVSAFCLGLVAWITHQPGFSVTVLNPKFHLLAARISHGPTHELDRAGWPVTQLSKLLHFADVNVMVPIRLPAMSKDSYAFAVRYNWDFSPNETGQMQAEVVDASGTVTLPRFWAGYSSERGEGKIWVLDTPLTNAVTLRLIPGIGQAPLAEFRITGR
jgi:hypothetical protein